MQITLHTDYAIRVLIYLGTRPERLVTIGEIAEAFDISRNHLVKVVHALAREGYVETVRGKNGGTRLGRDAARISLGELVRFSEPIHLLECFDQATDTCPITPACTVKGAFGKAQDAFMEVLDGHTLADMIVNAPKLVQLLDPTARPAAE